MSHLVTQQIRYFSQQLLKTIRLYMIVILQKSAAKSATCCPGININNIPLQNKRRDARVVEWDGLENRFTRKCNEGSNPSLSANCKKLWFLAFLLIMSD
jgi:hypothetical protein